MSKKKKTVLEAVDTLANLADLNVGREEQMPWLDPNKIEENQEEVRDTFRVINTYLRHAYQKEKGSLAELKVQKGLHAMIQLAGEAVEKVDRYTGLFKGAKTH